MFSAVPMTLFSRRAYLFLPLLLLLGSCSEDFEVSAPYKPVTVVFGLLNTGDTAHYIRIQKAFLDENKNALDMAQVADSNFHRSITVHFKEINNGSVVYDDILQRVNLNSENYPKAPGVFFYKDSSFAYKTTRFLNPERRYRLVIVDNETGDADSAETDIIPFATGFTIKEFDLPRPLNLGLDFKDINGNSPFFLQPLTIPANAMLFEGLIRVRYVEKNDLTGQQTDKSVDWQFASLKRGAIPFSLQTSHRSFYEFMRNEVADAPANTSRYIDTGEVYVWAATQDFVTYKDINGAQGGITGDQIKPIYTNIKGKDVYGLFTSRTFRSHTRAVVSDSTLYFLGSHPLTTRLNFVGRSDH